MAAFSIASSAPSSDLRRHRLELHRVELLEAVQRARLDAVFERRDRVQRNELAVWTADVDERELLRREPRATLDLRNDLVAAPLDVEAIDEVTAERRTDIAADLLHRQAHRTDLVAIEDDLRLRLIDVHVDDRREREVPRLRPVLCELLCELQDLCVARGRSDDDLDRERSQE